MSKGIDAGLAIAIVLGGLAVILLIVFAWPLFAALGTILLTIAAIFLPVILIVVAVVLVYRHLQSKRGY